MHLNDAILQMIIAQNNRNGFEIWKYLQKTCGQVRASQIIALWQEFLELKKNGESMIDFLNKVDSIVFKPQSADKKISDNLKIARVLKALPQEYDCFIAAIRFQQISYIELKERLVERSLAGSSNKQDMNSTSIATPAIHRIGRGRYNGGTGQGKKKTLYCTKCGRNNHTPDSCYAKQHVNKQNSSNQQGGFSGFALTATSNWSMDIVIDCGCTNHIIQTNQGLRRFLCWKGTEVRCLFLMGMGRNSDYMVLEKFVSHSTIVIKLRTRLISSAHCMCRASNFI